MERQRGKLSLRAIINLCFYSLGLLFGFCQSLCVPSNWPLSAYAVTAFSRVVRSFRITGSGRGGELAPNTIAIVTGQHINTCYKWFSNLLTTTAHRRKR